MFVARRPKSRRTPGRSIRPHLEALDSRIAPAVITATQSGLWSAASTWDGATPPGASDSAVIGTGINVTLNTSPTVAGVTVQAGGQLTFEPAASRTLSSSANVEVVGVLVKNGSAS